MVHLSYLIAVGPCLIMALAAVAMFILSSTLARTDHARLWAFSFALYAAEWGMIALFDALNIHTRWAALITSLLSIGAVFGYYAGFQKRRQRHTPKRLWTAVGAIVLFQLLFLHERLSGPLTFVGQAFFPLLRMALFGLAAMTLVPDRRRASATERSIFAMLVCVVIINACLLLMLVGEYFHQTPSASFMLGAAAASVPVSAAMGLFTLMLIASDFSRERMRLIHTDPLTGVLNRQGFEEAARRAISRARPPGRPLALALADIDRFKGINDRFGHLTGDAALISFAQHITDGLPDSALIGRFGGEEFALVLEGQDADGALPYVEGVRASLADMAIPGGTALDLTASFGIAEQVGRETLDDLYARADAALYRSKQDGRNRTSIDPARAA